MKKLMVVWILLILVIVCWAQDDCYINPVSLPDSVRQRGAGAFCLNGGGSGNLINNLAKDEYFRLITANHYLYDDPVPRPEGSYLEFVILPDWESLAADEDVLPDKKVIHVLAKIERRSLFADQIIYKIVDWYGDENFIVDIMEYGWVMSIPDSTPVVVFGHPHDKNDLHLKRFVQGKSAYYKRSYDGRVDYVCFSKPGFGTYGVGSSGSGMLDKYNRLVGVFKTGTTRQNCLDIGNGAVGYFPSLANDQRIRDYLGADSMKARTRKMFVKKKNPPAVVFESFKIKTDHNIVFLETNIDWLAGATNLEYWRASNNGPFVKIKTVTLDKKGLYSLVDTLDFNATIKYQLKAVNGWRYSASDVQETEVRVLGEYTGMQKKEKEEQLVKQLLAFPNPFNLSTTIQYEVEQTGSVSLRIFNITGQLVATLVEKNLLAGKYDIIWQAKNLSSGTYFVCLYTKSGRQTQKIFLKK